MTMGHTLAWFNPHAFSSIAGLEFSAQGMAEDRVWTLTLSPPDPNAGFWVGTIGPGGTVIWPTPLDPNPPAVCRLEGGGAPPQGGFIVQLQNFETIPSPTPPPDGGTSNIVQGGIIV